MTTNTKAAPVAAPEAVPAGFVLCRVLKNGDGKVSKGVTALDDEGQTVEQYYAKGDEFAVAKAIGDALESRGFVEVQ